VTESTSLPTSSRASACARPDRRSPGRALAGSSRSPAIGGCSCGPSLAPAGRPVMWSGSQEGPVSTGGEAAGRTLGGGAVSRPANASPTRTPATRSTSCHPRMATTTQPITARTCWPDTLPVTLVLTSHGNGGRIRAGCHREHERCRVTLEGTVPRYRLGSVRARLLGVLLLERLAPTRYLRPCWGPGSSALNGEAMLLRIYIGESDQWVVDIRSEAGRARLRRDDPIQRNDCLLPLRRQHCQRYPLTCGFGARGRIRTDDLRYESKRTHPPGAGLARSGCSGRWSRLLSAFLTCGVTAGG
jgi:hypothetical protein